MLLSNQRMSNSQTFNISCLRKNGELNEQAVIEETKDSYSIRLNPLHQQINHMDSYLTALFNLMMEYEKEYPYTFDEIYRTKRYEYSNGEFVEATIFHRVLMRKGSYFYVYQKSERGVRFLLYTMNRVHHSSVSLGFSMRMPVVENERKEMQELLKKQIIIDPELINNKELYFL